MSLCRERNMRDIWFERATAAVLRDAFRVETQVPNARSAGPVSSDQRVQLPDWLYGATSRSKTFSRYDLRKTTEGASL
jgi:hypothetical protein